MSLKSAYEIYLVDGVSGLNVFTGINQKQLPTQLPTKSATWRAEPSILSRWVSVIGSAGYAVRSLVQGKRDAEYMQVPGGVQQVF